MLARSSFGIGFFALSLLAATACSSDDDSSGSSGSSGAGGSGGGAGSSTGGSGGGSGGSAGSSSGASGSGGFSGSGAGAAGASGSSGSAGASNFDPYFFDDFESYGDGDSLSGHKPFDAAGRTSASSEAAKSGKQSAKMEIHAGDGGGFGEWGGIVNVSPALGKGEEIWVRLFVMWPQSFQFSASPYMKFLRLHNETASGGNGGYNDLYIDNADGPNSVLRTIKEIHDVWDVWDGPGLQRDVWERYEMYLYIDDQPVDDGGQGRVRIWRDDALIFDRTDVPTISEAGGRIDAFYLFTYWNNETPPDNFCYVDDLTIATSASPPPNQDAAGNAWIGSW